jgi:uncharacterized protein
VEDFVSVTVEPRVEDLLASIRKAIDDEDAAQNPAAHATEQSRAPRPTLREMRMAPEAAPVRSQRDVNAEIEDIRAKVDRNFTEAAKSRPVEPGPFSNIMGGGRRVPVEDYPSLRGATFPQDDYGQRYRAEPAPPPPPQERDWDYRPQPALMSPRPTQSAHASFERLAESMMARLGGDRTIEEVTRDLLRGMLRQWLDDNLPTLVERLVREEIERVARRGR